MKRHISKLVSAVLATVALCAATSIARGGTLTVYMSPPAAQSSTVSGITTETFDSLSTGIKTSTYSSAIGTYTGSSSNPFAILAPNQYGGATDSTHTSGTNYFAVGSATSSTAPVTVSLTHPAAYFGFWWSAGDASNRVDLYQGGTLYASFSTQNLLTFLNNGVGTVTALNGSTKYNTSAYYGNPNITSGSNDSGEPFVYISFAITGTTIDTIKFYNTGTASSFESDNHSYIPSGNTVTIPTTFVQVETINLTPTTATPTFNPLPGTYTSVQSVAISTTTSGASIRYTTDGSTPSETAGTLYSSAVSVGVTETLNAIAYKSGLADSAIASGAYTINLPAVATPTFSPAAGTYTSVQSVAISTTTSGASIRYTTDGSTPSETAGTLYSGAISVGVTETLKAIAYKSGMSDSTVASAAYTINLPVVATPTFSPGAGTYTGTQSVTISSTTSGASIRYTTDGSTPSETAGTLYSGAVSVGASATLKAIAYKSGMTDSSIASAAYTIVTATPTFSPGAGTYTSVQSVTVSTATSGASIRYTTDGSTPSETAGTLYSGAVSVGVTETLKAIAYKTGLSDSSIASAAYTINLPAVATPTFSPGAGTYTSVQSVTISTTTSGASIRYTTDGSTPSETAGTLYSGAVSVGVTETLKAIAYKSGMSDSAIASAAYTINLPVVATPTFNPVAGTYTTTQTVTISTTTSGATIRYTTDGSTPSETVGTVYSSAVSVSANETLNAIAYKTGMTDSAIGTAIYTIAPIVATPTFNPVAGTYTTTQTVTIATTTSGATIRYTTNGSTPSETVGTVYSSPVSVSTNETLNAIAYKTGMTDSTIGSAVYAISVATPTFNPTAGTYTTTQTVTIATTTSGASIRYTTDGSTPSETVGMVYSSPVSVSTTETLKALAYKTGMTDSAIGTAAYTIAPVVATPTFNPTAGTYTTTQTVTIATTTSGATIRYTTDGSTPSETVGTVYSSPVSVSTNETLNAIAYKTGMTDSTIGSAVYAIAVATPTFNPTAGSYTTAQTVTIATTTAGATIRYTTDGSTPSETVGTLYSSPVTVSTNETLNAIAYKTGLTDSAIGSAVYAVAVANPTFNPPAGSYATTQTVTIATTTSGATIRYTTDGSTPSETSGTLYSAPVSVSTNETLKAIAYKTGMADSAVASAAYVIAVASPTFNPPAGNYTATQTVTIATTTSGATIRYTTDGSTPSETVGTLYSSPVSVSKNETINAIAYATGMTDSTVPSAVYTIAPPVVTPTFSPAAGTYTTTQTVTISTTTSGASIRYTTDGSTPTETAGTLYSGPISVNVNETVNAIAYATGMSDSALASAAYNVPISVTLTPVPATLSGGQTQQFTATVFNTGNTAVTWATTPAGIGSVSGTGLYSAPTSVSSTQVLTVTATSVADTTKSAKAVLGLTPSGTVWISPQAVTLSASQTQQFSAGAAFTNSSVTWTISPTGLGTIDTTGFYTAPSCIYGTQTVTVTATSSANPSVSTSATVTLLNANGYSFARAITISHTQVPNSDQTNFPFLFNTTDPAFATLANGGHVTNPNGYDIIFSADPSGLTTLDYQVEQYNPSTGQMIAWIRIPTLSHTVDTVIYVFYGNLAVTSSQQNATHVWDSNFNGVWHFATPTTLSALDSTANANNGTIDGAPTVISGQIGWGANFGTYDNIAIQSIPLTGDYTISAWFSMPLPNNGGWNTLTRGVNSDHQVIVNEGNWHLGAYGNQNGGFWDSGFDMSTLAAGWHHMAAAAHRNVTTFYIDGAAVGSIPFQSSSQVSFLGNYQGNGQQFGSTDEIRVSTGIARSADWIAAEYKNQGSPSAFYTLAPEGPVSLSVSPLSISLFATQSQQFSTGQSTSCGSGVTWSLSPAGTGTIDATGLYTAPATVATQQTVTVTAMSASGAGGETATATVILLVPITVTPTTSTLSAGQTQQLTAVANGSVTWSINPSSAGSISSSGLYTAPPCVATQQTVTVTATTGAGQNASATITLLAGSGFGYHRIVVIDHTKVPNTDQANFPFLFSTIDPAFANTANGGHVTNPNGYDIIFSTDPNGLSTLNFELQQYNPATGQVIAWVRIPTLSHTSDTVLYVFYGNTSITTSQANPTAVWDSNFKGVWHFATPTTLSALDSTANANNGTINGSPSVIAGQIGWAADFAGNNDNLAIQSIPLAGVNYTISAWFNMPFPNAGGGWNTLTRGVNDDWQVIVNEGSSHLGSYGNGFFDSGFNMSTLSAGWHHLVANAQQGTTTFYVDAAPVGSVPFQSVAQISFLGNYQGGGQQFGGTEEIRISTGIVRSPDWIATEFNNQSSTSTFYALSPEGAAVSLSPAAITLYASQTQQFAGGVLANCNQSLTWTINPANAGTISASGLYTAPSSVATQQAVTVTATSQANSANSASATVTLYPPETITVTPATVPIYGGQTQQFTTSFTNALSTSVTWSVSPTGSGSISATGLYTAPATITTQQTLTVTATSQQNSSLAATATITLYPPVAVGVSPTTAILYGGQTQQFTASVIDTINPAVTWSVSPSGVGSITTGGLYSAPASITSVQPIMVTATSVTDPTKFASVTLNLAPQNTVIVVPQTVTLAPAQTQQFIAEVANSNTAVTWAINPPGVGTIDSTGFYTAPATNCDQQTVTITATSVANPSFSSTAIVTLSNANGYSHQRALTIDHTKIPNTDQTNFPVSINGTYPWLASTGNGGHVANPNGYDIVFTSDSMCVSKLNFEVEAWNAQTGQIAAWVQIPTLSHTSDTVIYACYGNPSISTNQGNAYGTWDGTFEGVWHFPNSTVLEANDSTSNANNATFLGGTTAAAGKFGGAASFNGVSNYIDIFNSPSLENWTTQTISIWTNIKPGANGNYTRLIEKGPGHEWSILWDGSNNIFVAAPVTEYLTSTVNIADSQWHKVDVTVDPQLVSIYIDGALNVTQPAVAPSATNGNIRIGAYAGGAQNFFNGLTDELRVSNVERSPDWIAAAFASENSPATFYTVGPELSETLAVSPGQETLYAAQSQQFTSSSPGACSPTVTWSIAPSGLGIISAAGLYTAPSTIATPEVVTVTATSQADSTKSASAVVTLFPPVSIGLTPTVTTIFSGQTQQFLASVGNAVNTGVTWSLNPTGVGSISAAGLYTAPAAISDPQTITITAISQADATKTASATITLAAGQGTPVTTTSIGNVLSLIADALCRRPHAAPVLTVSGNQSTSLTCPNGQPPCSATVNVTGVANSYQLNPGASLSYGWSMVSGPASVQFGTATSASTSATFTAPGDYVLQLSVNDGVSTSAAQTDVVVNPAPFGNGYTFLITPPVSGPNPVGTAITLQLQLIGYFTNGGPIQLTITGANPVVANLIADNNGFASYTYYGKNPGTDTVSGTATGWCCSPSFASNTATINWITAPPKLTSSPVTGQFFTADGTGTFDTPATAQPLFTQVFPNIDFNAAGVTSSVSNLTRPFTDVVTDLNGNFAGVLPAQGNNYQAGVGTLYSFSAVFTGSLNVPAAGPVTFAFTSDDAYVFGVGNGATATSGPRTNTPANTVFTGLPVMGGVNQRSAPASSSITVNFPAPGVYPYEVDYTKGGDKNLTLTMLANGVPIQPATLLTLSPNQGSPVQEKQIEELNVSALTTDGVAVGNLPVAVTVTGVNQQTRSLVTDGTGNVQFAYAGNPFVGVDQIQASAVVNGALIYSNVVTVPWNSGTNQAPVVSAGAPQTIILPAQAALSGTVTDDGLPSNTLTTTWTVLTGPGAVTFDDANQPATAATFTTPGVYTLQLSASDGALTTNSTVTITVNPNNNVSTGWILSPLDNAAVSGQVPITLISGITLVSGTLTYFPATNPQAVVTVNANTTGSGQIATLDATLLNNGGYFIILNGTNSQNVTQTSQVYVTAVGDYKPGRVTATITDLTVPAPGLPIQIQRTYDSLVRSTSSDFGYGWRLGINIQTQISPTGDVTLTINGKARTFYFTPPNNGVFSYFYTPQYTPEPGLYGSLSNTGDNCDGVLIHVGNIFECGLNNSGQVYQAIGYQYTDAYGRIYTLASDGTLQSVQDLNNNTLTITPTGITSSNGLNVPFVRDSQGRITQITDTLGNHYQYTYDSNGNLASVTYPSMATPAQYQYDTTHLLTQETDKRGNVAGSSTYYPDGKLQSVTDAVGNATQYSYNTATNTTTVTNPDGGTIVTVADSYGSPLTVTDPLGRVTQYTYDANHNQLTVTDALNKVTTFTYDSNGFRTSLRDPLGHTYTSVYNAVGGPASVTDPLSQSQSISYDSNFNISSITDSIGPVAAFTYNAQAQPLTVVNARGNTTTYTYDQYGNRLTATDALHRTTTLAYDTQGNLTSQTDPRGNKTQYGYDALNRKTVMTDAANNITHYAYDGNNNKISETDANNHVTSYIYDSANRLSQTTYADNTTRSYTYDFRGNRLTETDQLGRVTKNVYDRAGQLTSTTVAFGTSDAATTSYTYDLDGRKLTQTDPRNNTTHYAYDDAGHMTSTTDAVGNITSYGYDAKGQRTSMTDAKQRVTSYTYDARGRQLTTTTPDSRTVTKTYDGLGNVLTVTDEESRTTTYAYDAANQLTTVTDALNGVTQYGYDVSGNKTSQTDANSHTTHYVYDALNRRTSRTLPAGQAESFTYDAVGNKASHVDFNGKTTTFAYDSLNRLLSRMPDASFSAAPITFTYSSTGKRASMTDPTGTTNYTYSNRDQVLTKATPEGTLTYTYDLSGNVASVLSSNVNGTNVAYAWDADNRLSNLTDNGTSAMTNYTYDETSQLASMQYPNGVAHAFTYDNRDRPTNLGVTGPLGLSLSYAQTFSPSGRKSNVTEQSGRDTNYGYSSVYRLLNETVTGDPTTPNNGALTYVLDPVGNRSSLTSTLEALPNQSFTYDADDRLSSDTYDADGNTLTSSGHIFSYDFEDRLTQFDTSVQMSYDGDGNRITRTQGGSTIRYLVDDITPTGYPQVAEEVVNGSVAAQFTYGSWRISQKRSGVVSYYGYDDGGSVRELFSDTGAVTDTDTYDAFGNTVAQTGSTVNEFLYRGEQLDSVLGMYYLRARYYVPKSGRFLTADKFELSNRSDRARIRERLLEASHHRYLYSLGDGVNLIDPTGLSVIEGEIGVVDELLAASDVGDGLEIHHIIQARFAQILGVEEGEMMGIALSPDAHAFFDALWSIEIAQDGLSAETLLEDIVEVAEEIYAGEGPLEAWVAQWKASLQAIGAIP